MNILLDTHIAVWAIVDDPRLSQEARDLIMDPDNNLYLSAVSAFEVRNKSRNPKNNLEFTTREFLESCNEAGFLPLPLKSEHFLAETSLQWGGPGKEHSDPYDRLLLAQARSENFRLMTHDNMIRLFNEKFVIHV